MTSEPQTAKALLLPADGSKIRIVDYDIKERDEGDVVDSGMADFYDPIPNLKPWFRDAYQERAMACFHVDTKTRRYCDPINRAFIKSEDSVAWGQYCLYYTLFPTMSMNASCRRIIGSASPSQLFWRGDVLVVRYEGHLGLGHVYKDVEEVAMKAVEEVLRKAYKSHGLERVHAENGSLPLLAS